MEILHCSCSVGDDRKSASDLHKNSFFLKIRGTEFLLARGGGCVCVD